VLRERDEGAGTQASPFVRLIFPIGIAIGSWAADKKTDADSDADIDSEQFADEAMPGKETCSLLGIRHPILQGGMLWLADAELAASVSNAGALGTISPYAGMREDGNPLENLQLQIHRTRQLTDQPFAVNIPLDLPTSGLLINLLLEESVKIVVTAAGSPELFTELLHSSRIRVLHVVSSVAQARFAQSCGVDAVIAEGAEAGGRIGRDELPLFSLIPQVADAVSIPVIAAGGIVDGRGMAAALVLGADAVQLGTRFIATEECIAHPNYKKAILNASDTDTIVAGRALVPARRIKSTFPLKLSYMERSGVGADALQEFTGRGRARKAQLEGDMETGDPFAGSSAGMIREILPVQEVVEALVKECGETLGPDSNEVL
jgi:enoyl-[acyl-carrier protein] reductase II